MPGKTGLFCFSGGNIAWVGFLWGSLGPSFGREMRPRSLILCPLSSWKHQESDLWVVVGKNITLPALLLPLRRHCFSQEVFIVFPIYWSFFFLLSQIPIFQRDEQIFFSVTFKIINQLKGEAVIPLKWCAFYLGSFRLWEKLTARTEKTPLNATWQGKS